MDIKAIYKVHDDFGNFGVINEITEFKAYKDDPYPGTAYQVVISSGYNAGTVYHVSIFESLEDAKHDIQKLSCGTFKFEFIGA